MQLQQFKSTLWDAASVYLVVNATNGNNNNKLQQQERQATNKQLAICGNASVSWRSIFTDNLHMQSASKDEMLGA